jgi:tRNA modification GTPase
MGTRDTICALASGAPPSAIAVVRISGPAVYEIGALLLSGGLPPARRASLTRLSDRAGNLVDEGIALFSPAPSSYTGEDTLELFLHGGPAVITHALTALTSMSDVRLAEPGEFTRRAFEAGKLNLTQAEGVADLIEAETLAQKGQALRQLSGALSATYSGWRDELMGLLALVEVLIDFPDEGDVAPDVAYPVRTRVDGLIKDVEAALGDGGIGERIRDGFRIAIIGAPNAGKSTLLNRLAGREAAIVTARPGTTRDVIEIRRVLGGQVVWIADTAGLRETEDEIEAEGIRRARMTAEDADLCLLLIDASDPSAPPPLPFLPPKGIIVINKSDLAGPGALPASDFIICAKHGAGIDNLEAGLSARIAALAASVESPVITRARHREKLTRGLAALASAQTAIDQDLGFELVAEDLRLAIREMQAIIGEIGVEDVLGAVFSRFCIGK